MFAQKKRSLVPKITTKSWPKQHGLSLYSLELCASQAVGTQPVVRPHACEAQSSIIVILKLMYMTNMVNTNDPTKEKNKKPPSDCGKDVSPDFASPHVFIAIVIRLRLKLNTRTG